MMNIMKIFKKTNFYIDKKLIYIIFKINNNNK